MKLLKYIWMILAAGLFSACTDDLIDDAGTQKWQDQADGIEINIAPDDLVPVVMNSSRTSGSDALDGQLNTIADLNIRVHTTKGHVDFYATAENNFANIMVNGKPSKSKAENGAFTVQKPNYDRPHSKTIHCGSYVRAGEVTKIEAIANQGANLHSADKGDWSKYYDDAPLNKDLVHCKMYGVWNKKDVSDQPVHNHDDVHCKLFTMQIRRSVALVTVKMVDNGLNKGVEITPTKLRLCNVPDKCQLTALGHATGKLGNQITTLTAKKTSDIASSAVGMEYTFDYINGRTLNGVTKQLGGHIEKGSATLPDYFFPLFMYENTQGKHNTHNTVHKTKYPTGITNPVEAKDRNKNFKYSYVEIEAEYRYKDPKTSTVKVSGNIIYRFFLGADAITDFSVEGNGYYKLTLYLKGFGGAKEDGKVDSKGNLVVNKEDASWRVDMNTKDWGFEKDQFDFDSHFIAGTAKVVGTGWHIKGVSKGHGDGNASWVSFKVTGFGSEYADPTQFAGSVQLYNENGTIFYHIEPLHYGSEGIDPGGAFDATTYKSSKPYREMWIDVENTSVTPAQTQTVRIRQYAPIPIWVGQNVYFMERFEENEPNVIGFPWNYEGVDVLTYPNFHIWDDSGSAASVYGWKYAAGVVTDYVQLAQNTELLSYERNLSTAQGAWTEQDRNATVNGKTVPGGYGSAAHVCMRKGLISNYGTDCRNYCLPSSSIMQAMLDYTKNNIHQEAWGPFEPIHIYEDYWTSDIKSGLGTETAFYKGTQDAGGFVYTANRGLRKRVRAVYASSLGYYSPKLPASPNYK